MNNDAAISAVLIAGGGPVGSVLALALSQAGIGCTLVDKGAGEQSEGMSERRPIALSSSSARILHTLGVWDQIATRACPIHMVHVGEAGRFGAVRLRADEQNVPALGYVTDASVIVAELDRALGNASAIKRVRACVSDARTESQQVSALLDTEPRSELAAQLLVAADGGRSSLCTQLGIQVDSARYQQSAVVCNVTLGKPHHGVAYERFTSSGPLAMLPLASGDSALVWTLPEDRAQHIAELDDSEFLRALQQAFGHRLGQLRGASSRNLFPLSLVRAQQITRTRVALIGNAANQLHPVAGQGMNLGLRDAAVLAELIVQAVRQGEDAGDAAMLERFAQRRRDEHRGVVRFTDMLARGFTVGPSWLGWLRSAGMLAIDLLPGISNRLARHAMGLGGEQPRLVRGVRL